MAHLVEYIPSDPGSNPPWVICSASFPSLSTCFLPVFTLSLSNKGKISDTDTLFTKSKISQWTLVNAFLFIKAFCFGSQIKPHYLKSENLPKYQFSLKIVHVSYFLDHIKINIAWLSSHFLNLSSLSALFQGVETPCASLEQLKDLISTRSRRCHTPTSALLLEGVSWKPFMNPERLTKDTLRTTIHSLVRDKSIRVR